MNEFEQDRSGTENTIIRTGKILGGLVLGAAFGYATAKGAELIIPIDETSINLYEGLVTGALALGGAFVAAEATE